MKGESISYIPTYYIYITSPGHISTEEKTKYVHKNAEPLACFVCFGMKGQVREGSSMKH